MTVSLSDQSSGDMLLEDECQTTLGCVMYFIIAPILYLLVAVFIFCGNTLTITAVCKSSKLRTLPNMYIVSLACADLLTGLYVFILAFLHIQATHVMTGHSKVFCLFMYVIFVIGNISSSINMTLIALDRYIYISHPFTYPRLVTSDRTKYTITASWIFAILVGLCAIYFNSFDDVGECSFVHVLDHVYQLLTQTGIYVLTFITVVFLYSRIIKISIKQRTTIAASGHMTNVSWRHSLKSIRLLLCVCLVHVLCWMPTHLLMLLSLLNKDWSSNLTFTFILGLVNSGLNFIIYPLMNKDFRTAFRSIFCEKKDYVSTSHIPMLVHASRKTVSVINI